MRDMNIRFPSDVELRKKWIAAINRKKFTPSKRTVLCSNNFLIFLGKRRLHSTAVPTIFDFPKQIVKGGVPTTSRNTLTANNVYVYCSIIILNLYNNKTLNLCRPTEENIAKFRCEQTITSHMSIPDIISDK